MCQKAREFGYTAALQVKLKKRKVKIQLTQEI